MDGAKLLGGENLWDLWGNPGVRWRSVPKQCNEAKNMVENGWVQNNIVTLSFHQFLHDMIHVQLFLIWSLHIYRSSLKTPRTVRREPTNQDAKNKAQLWLPCLAEHFQGSLEDQQAYSASKAIKN